MKIAEKDEKFQEKKIGTSEYVNENCWLAKTVNHPPGERCQYCELRFRECLFFQYLIISSILALLFLAVSFFVEGKISNTVVISIFVLVVVYGRFFSQSTEKIIKANFAERKAKQSLEKLTEGLEDQIDQRTKELKDAYIKLKKLDESKDGFLLTVQHQLRTPLSGIKWLIETLQGGGLGRVSLKQKEYLNDIYKMNERMIKLVLDMLNVINVESDTSDIKKETVCLSDFCEEFITGLSAPAKSKGVVINTVCKDKNKIEVETNKQALKMILECLASNAINYSSPGQEIVLNAEEEAGSIIFSVKDSGIGIPKDEQKKIFERFYRASNAKAFKPDGTGLGLYIASVLTEKIGGKLYLKSEEGKGSTFYLSVSKKAI